MPRGELKWEMLDDSLILGLLSLAAGKRQQEPELGKGKVR
jgi:hypothetical protein